MDWWAFVSTLVGAGVSIVTSLAVFGFTLWTESRKVKAETKTKDAFSAFRGFQKLVQIANDLTNTQRHIDEAFKEASEHGLEEADPYIKVNPLVGAKVVLEPPRIEEMFFLVDAKLTHVMGEIDLMYRRALNTEAVVEKFNTMKLEFGQFLEARTKKIEGLDGTRVAFELVGQDAKVAELRGGAMNNLLGQLLEHLEKDCSEAKRLAETFLKAAQEHFGPDFPKVKLEWMY